ncbi:MAG: ABC transporter permease [Bacteroidetes bacterium]|nr:ABC transporter permease [Bacteroidota bacterium]
MLKYILKRILFFIPTLLVVSLLTFALGVNSPGDPVEVLMDNSESAKFADQTSRRADYMKMRKKLNLDLPVFYFGVSSIAEPDTLYKIPEKLHRENLERFISMYGNWPQVSLYYTQVKALESAVSGMVVTDSLKDQLIKVRLLISELYYKYDPSVVKSKHEQLSDCFHVLHPEHNYMKELTTSYAAMVDGATVWKNYFPSFHWYGFNNQYHIWIVNLFKGDFGISYYKKQPVIDMISGRMLPTLLFSVLSVLIAFLVSIPLGVHSAVNKGTAKDKFYTIALFVFYSLPSFWVATLLINYLTNAEYLDWFPVKGLEDAADDASFGDRMLNYLHHMILPLFCYTYASFAFISRQMRGSMLQTLGQDYIRTAWAKGLAPKQVYWKHAVRNSLLPIITLVASIFPSLIAGSVVIEYLFTLPGMGRLAYEAEVSKDYPVIYIIMLFSAVLTLVGYLVADILYAVVDPRISYNKK